MLHFFSLLWQKPFSLLHITHSCFTSLLNEGVCVCPPSQHVVMMRPDLLAVSLLAAHQVASLPQSATNLSDYIPLSWEALQ